MKKTYVLDTNVILHDYDAIYSFEDNDLIIPIVVFEELDKFKKGNSIINFNARQIMRELDKMSENEQLFDSGINLGEGKGKLYVKLIPKYDDNMARSFSATDYADNKILALVNELAKNSKNDVVLVTQDINLRLKARALGLQSQDYQTGKIENINHIVEANGKVFIETDLIKKLYQIGNLTIEECNIERNLENNEYFIVTDGNSDALVVVDNHKRVLRLINKRNASRIKPRNAEQIFAMDALLNKNIELVSLTGKAGTGKTLLALAAALQQSNEYYQVMLARPIVALSEKDLGYLPGSAKEKIRPYMQPLFDNLTVIKQSIGESSREAQKFDQMLEDEKLIIEPLAYIRGRSISKTFFIVDEAQNLTPHEVKTIITRAGEGTKIVFTGDIDQIDSPYLDDRSNGLSYLTDKMMGQKLFAHINLVKGERSELAELASKLL